MTDSKTIAGYIQNKPRTYCSGKNLGNAQTHTHNNETRQRDRKQLKISEGPKLE